VEEVRGGFLTTRVAGTHKKWTGALGMEEVIRRVLLGEEDADAQDGDEDLQGPLTKEAVDRQVAKLEEHLK
jgi:hypothetical protein